MTKYRSLNAFVVALQMIRYWQFWLLITLIAPGSTTHKAVLKRDKMRVFDWEWRKWKMQYTGLNTNSPLLHTNYIPNTVQYQTSVNSALLWQIHLAKIWNHSNLLLYFYICSSVFLTKWTHSEEPFEALLC